MTEQKRHILTGEGLAELEKYFMEHKDDLFRIAWKNFVDKHIRPYQNGREKVLKYLEPLKEGDIIGFGRYRDIIETEGEINFIGKTGIGIEVRHYNGCNGGMTGSTEFTLPIKNVKLVRRWIPVSELRSKGGEPE